ncbi:chromosome condensation protein CrcB [Blumeria hordei DH14]|uniref:Chromosome condensation protein CrcB n=1 Tax=Blumeria graminis f. sp. hordei (strain DH14) TaxID=546991 RepID=N1JR95_BLUG1|nr:chromosome condensation protein CrcB [Blumeria hordei DH14]
MATLLHHDVISEIPSEAVIPQRLEKNYTGALSRCSVHFFTGSYLIFFSFLGTLARLGLQALTSFPGAPVAFGGVWANFTGTAIIGFLIQDSKIFKCGLEFPVNSVNGREPQRTGREETEAQSHGLDTATARQVNLAMKKRIPLYIGLTTGFCGCCTSFSSFLRDAFLGLTNNLRPSGSEIIAVSPTLMDSNEIGHSVMALLAVIIVTMSISICALYIGEQMADLLEPYIPSVSFKFVPRFFDPCVAVIAWVIWLSLIVLAISHQNRLDKEIDEWLEALIFSLVFAPLGCLTRYYTSLHLNNRVSNFPLATFLVNVIGTTILAVAYDLQHMAILDTFQDRILQGVQDGFCGCLTTVSTWIAELTNLPRKSAYIYGLASVVIALCFTITIIGTLIWTRGFSG